MPGFGLVHVLAEGRASVPTTGLLHEPKRFFRYTIKSLAPHVAHPFFLR